MTLTKLLKLEIGVAIMKDGEVIQIATPEEMSANPANDYVKTLY